MANLKIIFLFRWFHEIRLTRCCNPERFNSKYAFRFTTSLRFKHINTETAVKKPTFDQPRIYMLLVHGQKIDYAMRPMTHHALLKYAAVWV